MTTQLLRVARFFMSSLCILFLLAMPCRQICADEALPSQDTIAHPSKADLGEPSDHQPWTTRVMNALNPSQTCPHCKQTFTQNRSMWMLVIGFVGQILFTGRFVVQWIASERRKQSYFPLIFWYLSIGGSVLLFAYAVSIMAWPIIMGQGFGVIVYARNLTLIARHKASEAEKMEEPPTEA